MSERRIIEALAKAGTITRPSSYFYATLPCFGHGREVSGGVQTDGGRRATLGASTTALLKGVRSYPGSHHQPTA